MNPSEILSHLTSDDPRRNEAAKALLALLSNLARLRLTEPSSGGVFEIRSGQDRDEVVSRVMLKVIQLSPLPVAGKSDGECRRYLSTMLVRAHITEHRKRSRLVLTEADKMPAPKVSSSSDDAPSEEAESWIVRARSLLDRVVAEVIAARQERFREPVAVAWRQIGELVFDNVPFQRLLERDEGVSAASPRDEFVRARNRVFKNHERLRIALRETAEAMASSGALNGEEAAQVRQSILLLFRCQNSPASRVGPGTLAS